MKLFASDRTRLTTFIALLFFSSGFSSLMLQTSWNRILAQVIGIDFESQVVVVSIFMLGLGLGTYVGGLITRHLDQPLYFFAFAEISISIFAFFSDVILRIVQKLLSEATLGNFGLLGLSIDFVGYSSVLLLPIVLMGTSLPIVIHSVRNHFSAGIATGTFYGINLLGAAIGSLASGVYLLGEYGIRGVLIIAGCVNLLLSVGFILIVRSAKVEPSALIVGEKHLNFEKYRVPVDIKMLAFACGFISIGFEVFFLRILPFFFGAKSYIFPIALSAFLLHVMIGSLISAKFLRLQKEPKALLILSLYGAILLSLVPFVFANVIVHLFPKYGISSFVLPDNTSFAQLLLVWLCVLFLMSSVIPISMAFPLIVSMNKIRNNEVGSAVSSTYFLTTCGNFVATLVLGALLIPNLGVIVSYLFLIIVVGFVLFYLTRSKQQNRFFKITVFNTVLYLLVIYISQGFYSTAHYKFEPPVRVHNELNGTILVHPTLDDNGVINGFRINSGSEPATSFDILDRGWKQKDHKIDASIAALGYAPSRVLIVGIGTGDFAIDIHNYFPKAKIVVVELFDSVIKEMLLYGSPELRDVLENSEIHILDGARFINNLDISKEKNKFDLIQIGVSHVTAAGAGNLFTREFLASASQSLHRNGVISTNAYAPVIAMLKKDNKNFFVYSSGDGFAADLFITMKPNSDKELLNRFRFSYQNMCVKAIAGAETELIGFAPGIENFVINSDKGFSSQLKDIQPLTYNNLVTDHFIFQRNAIPGQVDPRVWESNYASITGQVLRSTWLESCFK